LNRLRRANGATPLGRVFSPWNFLAYAIDIFAAAGAVRATHR